MQKVKIKVSMQLDKYTKYNTSVAHHHVWSLKKQRKNLRKGSILQATIRPATNYSPTAVVIGGIPYPTMLFKILPT